MRTKDSNSSPSRKSHWLIRLVRWCVSIPLCVITRPKGLRYDEGIGYTAYKSVSFGMEWRILYYCDDWGIWRSNGKVGASSQNARGEARRQ